MRNYILLGISILSGLAAFVITKDYIANERRKLDLEGAKVLVLGITFKENCPDIRNSRVIDVIQELKEFGTDVAVYDPWADSAEVKREYGLELIDSLNSKYDAVVLAVAHDKFDGLDIEQLINGNDTVV